jgi:hypothetical protein
MSSTHANSIKYINDLQKYISIYLGPLITFHPNLSIIHVSLIFARNLSILSTYFDYLKMCRSFLSRSYLIEMCRSYLIEMCRLYLIEMCRSFLIEMCRSHLSRCVVHNYPDVPIIVIQNFRSHLFKRSDHCYRNVSIIRYYNLSNIRSVTFDRNVSIIFNFRFSCFKREWLANSPNKVDSFLSWELIRTR